MAEDLLEPDEDGVIEKNGVAYLRARHLLDLLWLRETAAARGLAQREGIQGSAVGLVFDEWRVRSDLPAVLFFGKTDGPRLGKLFLSDAEGLPMKLLPRKQGRQLGGIWCHHQTLDLDDYSFWLGGGHDGIPAQTEESATRDWDVASPLQRLKTGSVDGKESCLIEGVPTAIVGGVPVAPPITSENTGKGQSVQGTVAQALQLGEKRYVMTAGHVVDQVGEPLVFGWRSPEMNVSAVTAAKIYGDATHQTVRDYFQQLGLEDEFIPPLGVFESKENPFEADCGLGEVIQSLAVAAGTYSSLPESREDPEQPFQNIQLQQSRRKPGFWPLGEDILAVGPMSGRQLGRVLGYAVWTKDLQTYQDYAVVALPGYQMNFDGDSGKPFVTVRGNHLLGMLIGTIYPGANHRLHARVMDIQRAKKLLSAQLSPISSSQTTPTYNI